MNTRSFTMTISASTLALWTLTSTTFAAAGDRPSGPRPPGLTSVRDQVRVFHDADGDFLRLQDGEEFKLTPLPENVQKEIEENAARVDAALEQSGNTPISAATATQGAGAGAAATVDNRRFQGPIRNQAGRGTCVSHSTVAALEGAYRRTDPTRFKDLDLSEQYAAHVQNMVALAGAFGSDLSSVPSMANWRENQMGCWGGSWNHYLMRVLQRYGVTTEDVMRYNPLASYENTNELGDNPRINEADPTARQAVVDGFNLDQNNLPLTALDQAPYRPTTVVELNQQQVRNSAYLEQILTAGYDVVIDTALPDPSQLSLDQNGAWTVLPSTKCPYGHSMLIVGFNHTQQYFIVRNSWNGKGPGDVDNGYTRISYLFFQKFADDGSYITGVADPAQGSNGAQLCIGRWALEVDGDTFTLDINRLPQFYSSQELKGQKDYRIGTLLWAGYTYRVNGYWSNGSLVLVLNGNNPNLPYGSLDGIELEIDQFSPDQQSMAGTAYISGDEYPLQADRQVR